MSYINFNYVTNPPNDELVDYHTQINDNWSELDDKLEPFNKQHNTIIAPPIGTEAMDPVINEPAVWTGSAWHNIQRSTWTEWELLPVRSPRVNVAGYPLMYAIDHASRRVALRGRVSYDNISSAWPQGYVEITTDTSFGTTAYNPVGDLSIMQMATAPIGTNTSVYRGAVVWVQPLTTPNRTAVFARFQGNDSGGSPNWIDFSGFTWWF